MPVPIDLEEGLLGQVDIEPVEDDENVVDSPVRTVPEGPSVTSPLWQDFVLKHFEDDEKVDGKPRLGGLRRVAEFLLGPVLNSRVHIVQAPNPANEMTAVVEYTIEVMWARGDQGLHDAHMRTFMGTADSNKGNNGEEPFSNYPTAIAETRAEARAFKKALHLTVLAAEETMPAAASVSAFDQEAPTAIEESQKAFITRLCKTLNLDLGKFLNSGKGGTKYASICDVSYNVAKSMIRKLQEYQENRGSIPPDISLRAARA